MAGSLDRDQGRPDLAGHQCRDSKAPHLLHMDTHKCNLEYALLRQHLHFGQKGMLLFEHRTEDTA